MTTLTHCPVCHHSSFQDYLTCKDFTTTGEIFPIIQCQKCSFTFTNPRPLDNDLGKYYESSDYISHSNAKKGIFNRVYQLVRTRAIQSKLNLVQSLNQNGLIIDYGCGTGEFLGYVQSKGRKVLGVEPSDHARNQAINNQNLKVLSLSEFPEIQKNHASVITLWHVLEHVPNLRETLTSFHSILENKGHLVIAVPNYTSHDAQVYKEFWAGYDVPRHLWHFSPNVIQSLVESEGFELLTMKGMPFDSFYVSMLSEKYKSGSLNPIKAFFVGLKSNIKSIGKPQNTSSVIYIFRKK
jgi:SAM-dependent methyltransferase